MCKALKLAILFKDGKRGDQDAELCALRAMSAKMRRRPDSGTVGLLPDAGRAVRGKGDAALLGRAGHFRQLRQRLRNDLHTVIFNLGSIINVGVAIILTFIFLEKIIKKESKNEGNPLE